MFRSITRSRARATAVLIRCSLTLLTSLAPVVAMAAIPTPAHAAFSGGNGKIAYVSYPGGNVTGNGEIFVMNADGTGQTRLTNNAWEDTEPSWSPDGSRIAFATTRDGNYDVYVMNADGTGQTNVSSQSSYEASPAWSPDGTKLAFMTTRDPVSGTEIYVMNADGTGASRLTNNSYYDWYPAWSPDGSKIAFTSVREGFQDVYVMNADGSGEVKLTGTNSSHDSRPSWSPDGTKIVFVRGDSWADATDLWTMDPDGTGQVNLTNNATSNDDGVWSPDGAKLVFQSYDVDWEIFVMNSDGTSQVNLSNNPTAFDLYPDWQQADTVLPLDPTLSSPSHTTGVVSDDPTVEVTWSGAADPGSGVDGYSYEWSTSETTVPDNNKDAEEGATGTISPSLADGSHWFHLRTRDNAGNWTATVHLGPFVIDAVNDAPAGSDNGVALDENATFTFAVADFGFTDPDNTPPDAFDRVKITTLPGVGMLRNDGVDVTAGGFVTAADIAAGKLVFHPAANHHGVTSFTFQVADDGGTAGGGVDLDPTPNTITVTVTSSGGGDVTPPETTITTGPSGDVSESEAAFEFKSNESGSRFECKLDAGSWLACSSPQSFSDLTEGSHTFWVRAIDGAGNIDPTPAEAVWTVDLTAPPVPQMVEPATHFRTDTDFTVSWMSQADLLAAGNLLYDVQYREAPLAGDFGTWQELTSASADTEITFHGATDITYGFQVRARDDAGNLSEWSDEKLTSVPVDDTELVHKGIWAQRYGEGRYLDTFSVSREKGARLVLTHVETGHLTLLVSKGPNAGSIAVRWNGEVIKRISLFAPTVRHMKLVGVKDFIGIESGRLVIEVISKGKPVTIEGVGACRD